MRQWGREGLLAEHSEMYPVELQMQLRKMAIEPCVHPARNNSRQINQPYNSDIEEAVFLECRKVLYGQFVL